VLFTAYLTWRTGSIEAEEMVAVVAVTVAGGALTRMAVVIFRLRPLSLP
jgi:hypothetical protein